QEKTRAMGLGQPQHPRRAFGIDTNGLERIGPVADRTRRASQMKDYVDRDIQRFGHIVAQKRKARIVTQRLDVTLASGQQVIRTDDFMSVAQQPRTEMRADESG